MKNNLLYWVFFPILLSCYKDKNTPTATGCNIEHVYDDNAKKLTITGGVWGTVSSLEGDFMPKIMGSKPEGSHCPVQRTLKIYQYSLLSDGIKSDPSSIFFDSLNTGFVTQVESDQNGFFQAAIPAGHYSIVIVENGQLYATLLDEHGGLSPITVSTGTVNSNLIMTYKATF